MKQRYNPNWDRFHSASRKVIKRYKKCKTILGFELYDWFLRLEKIFQFMVGDNIFSHQDAFARVTITSIDFETFPFKHVPRRRRKFGASRFSIVDKYVITTVDNSGVYHTIDPYFSDPIIFDSNTNENDDKEPYNLKESQSYADLNLFINDYSKARIRPGIYNRKSKRVSIKEKKMLASIKLEDRLEFLKKQRAKNWTQRSLK
jgi:hypothetical protein